jgi:hypothetical protein
VISHRKRFIFVHIPKTGGTSVAQALGRYGTFLQGEQNYESLYFKHARARDIRRMLGDEFTRYYTFTIVRNPWDWAVSSYTFNRGMHGPYIRDTGHKVASTVPDFAADWEFKRWLRWWIDTFRPVQSSMLTDEAGAMLVGDVVRFEELDAEFPRLCRRLGLWGWRRLPHVNRTPGRERDYRTYYDAESRDWIERQFEEDVRRFAYCFDGLAPGACR